MPLQNDIVRDRKGRLVYANPRGPLQLLTQENVHRGPNSRVGEPEAEMKVRSPRCSAAVRAVLLCKR